jgi:hypothetical protein
MRRMKTLISFGCAVCLTAGAAHAASGVLIVEKTTSGGAPQTTQMQIEPNRMRAGSADPGSAKNVFIFDGTKQVMYIIDGSKKTYSEVTKADMDALAGQFSDAMAKMRQQMEKMPPEQRQQLEAIMKGRGGMGAGAPVKPKTTYKKIGTDTVGKWTCDKYEGYDEGQKTSEVCTVDPKVLGFTASDFAVTEKFAEFFGKLMPANARQMFTFSAETQGFSGVPVRRVRTVAGQTITSEIAEVSRQSFSDATFAVPVGYQKVEFAGGRRGR